ncbi:MAG TPA: bifunctional (p)ppGpp synthetase/guanosine-3',5'-bis(diphosphate) 3'-pyrophosphohydrolase, partial [Chthonomonadales bacterium]|nr:bifunctional (p)ppGpp synthetase/guanosine-3',5'-bis(diphosphate) 3'-pyrophosphohydrolase [Chthonomonadales bacterium]
MSVALKNHIPPPVPTGLPAPAGADDLRAIHRILDRVSSYRPHADTNLISRAYLFARECHSGQKRRDGAPYITHPVEVTEILTELEMDEQALAAGLLHDVVEDCGVPISEVETLFGHDVARLVDAVTKLHIAGVDEAKSRANPGEDDSAELSPAAAERITRLAESARNAANTRKLFVAMAKDLRVMMIKLADRLHNMRTLAALKPERRFRIATETLKIFAPLAHRLGMWKIKSQLEDLAFQYTNPEAFQEISELVRQDTETRQAEVDADIAILKAALEKEGINAEVTGRPKHLYSIYTKMMQQNLQFSELLDLTALRVIVPVRGDCYLALGVVNALWAPIPGMFTDYIATAKSNLYQSLHQKVIGPKGTPLEVQIRTWEMHRTAEFGVAAHWQYKEGGKASDQFERRLASLRERMLDWRTDSGDHSKQLKEITEELFAEQVFVLSPKGDLFDLPAGSTPIDFAFRIHSDVGLQLAGAKVNGRMAPITYKFKNLDVVEVKTKPNASPSKDWIQFAKTAHARSKIRSYFKKLNYAENVQSGREALEKELGRQLDREVKSLREELRSSAPEKEIAHQVERRAKALADELRALSKDESLRAVAPLFNVKTEMELLASIGSGTISAVSVINRLRPGKSQAPPGIVVGGQRSNDSKLQVSGQELDGVNVLFRRSRCCLPIPGDDVVGYVTRGSGMALHRN